MEHSFEHFGPSRRDYSRYLWIRQARRALAKSVMHTPRFVCVRTHQLFQQKKKCPPLVPGTLGLKLSPLGPLGQKPGRLRPGPTDYGLPGDCGLLQIPDRPLDHGLFWYLVLVGRNRKAPTPTPASLHKHSNWSLHWSLNAPRPILTPPPQPQGRGAFKLQCKLQFKCLCKLGGVGVGAFLFLPR